MTSLQMMTTLKLAGMRAAYDDILDELGYLPFVQAGGAVDRPRGARSR